MKKVIKRLLTACIALLFMFPSNAAADDWFEPDPGYFTLLDDNGKELTLMAREIFKDDEYISGDNKHYLVTKVDKKKRTATAKLLGEVSLPVSVQEVETTAAAAPKDGSILLYATHNSESYVPTDGTESKKGDGGILDVAEALHDSLKKKGIKAVLDKAHHDPHDAGAYRRSRQTAIKLIKSNMPVMATFDIHRDAVPKSQYVAEVDGEDMTKVRIVIGRRNQNRKANEQLAYKIKSIADKNYPGLIKDIFIGHGSYNQELSPRSLLFEFGSHENSKPAAEKAAAYMADVIQKTFFGGTSQKQDQSSGEAEGPESKVRPISQERSQGGGRGIVWIVLVAVLGLGGFFLISMGGKEMFNKNKR